MNELVSTGLLPRNSLTGKVGFELKYHGLEIKCPQQVRVLYSCFPVAGTGVGCCRTISGEAWLEEVGVQEVKLYSSASLPVASLLAVLLSCEEGWSSSRVLP